jgi:hypothetical protein
LSFVDGAPPFRIVPNSDGLRHIEVPVPHLESYSPTHDAALLLAIAAGVRGAVERLPLTSDIRAELLGRVNAWENEKCRALMHIVNRN